MTTTPSDSSWPQLAANDPPTASARYFGVVLTALVILGVVLRVGVSLALGFHESPGQGSDAWEYDTYARSLASGLGYFGPSPDLPEFHTTAFRTPGVSLPWALLYVLFGQDPGVIRVFHALLGGATVALVGLIGRRCFGPLVGLLAGAVVGTHPILIFYSHELMSESLAIFLVALTTWWGLTLADHPSWPRLIILGLVLGYSVLVRPNLIFTLPPLWLWGWWVFRRRDRNQRAWALAVPLATLGLTVLCMLPWTIRNVLAMNEFIPLSTLGGTTLLGAYNHRVLEEADLAGYWVYDGALPEYGDLLRRTAAEQGEVARDRLALRLTRQWIVEHSDQLPRLWMLRLARAWTPFLQPKVEFKRRLLYTATWGPILVLLMIGVIPSAVAFAHRDPAGLILHVGLVQFLMTTLVFYGASRFRAPVEPLCILIAAATAWNLIQGWPWRRGWILRTDLATASAETRPVQVEATP